MNRSLKSARPGQLDVGDLVEDGVRGGALGDRQRDDLRALAGDVAGGDDPRQRQPRHEPDLHRARSGEVRAERAAEQHLRDLRRVDAEVVAEDRPAGRDRRLRELQLAHVALREEDVRREVEDVLLADLPEPLRGAEHEAAGVVEDAGADELGHGVDEPGAAEPERLDVADHGQLHLAVDDPHAFDRAFGCAHPAADLRRLERRAGRRGARERALRRAEHDLRVGADVDEEPRPLVEREPGREHAGDDVRPDVRAERREQHRGRALVHRHAEVGGLRLGQPPRRDRERRHRERLRDRCRARAGSSSRCR